MAALSSLEMERMISDYNTKTYAPEKEYILQVITERGSTDELKAFLAGLEATGVDAARTPHEFKTTVS